MNKVEQAVIRLLQKNPWYGHVLTYIKKVPSTKVQTAGITFKNQEIVLYINEEFFDFNSAISKENRELQQEEILIHEIGHLYNGHIFLYNGITSRDNVAMDMAINHNCPNLEGAMRAEMINENNGETHKYYLEKLPKDFEGICSDDHDVWKECDISPEHAKEILKDIAKKAKSKSGNIPNNLALQIESLFSSKLNWKSILNTFIINSIKTDAERTRKKLNRRYGILFPGKRIKRKSKIAVCVDTSGSVSDDELKVFFSEIHRIWQLSKTTINVIPCDSEIKETFEYKGKLSNIKLSGRGGTMFQPALQYLKNREYDGIIYFTDGDTPFDIDDMIKPEVPILFIQTRELNKYKKWGKYLKVDL